MSSSKNKKPEFTRNETGWRAASGLAVVSGLFSLVVCVSLIANYLQIRAVDPLDNPELLRLREQLAESSTTDEALVEQIRALDLLSRKAFFTSQAQLRTGGILLLAGSIVFLIAFRVAMRWRSRPPSPEGGPHEDRHWREAALSRELVTGTAVILVLAALTAAYLTPSTVPLAGEPELPADGEQAEAVVPDTAVFPAWEVVRTQWPSFRGPGGIGVAFHTSAPTQWDGASGEGIKWKVEVPLPGFNSPVVWDNRLFLSGASETQREVFCFDTETGELVWRQAVGPFPGTPGTPPDVSEDTGFAAPTMAIHGDRACVIFATGDLACFDFQGNLLWGRNAGVPDNHYGHASSLIAHDGLLYVQLDDKTQPRVLALDLATGEETWMAARKKISWASPACPATPFGFQLLLASERDVDAYDPATGALLWTQECLDGEVAPSPAYAVDTVFVANEYAIATAVRLGGTEGAIQPEIAWEWEDSLPEVSSPVGSDGHFYIATSMGEIVCLARETGELVWLEEFDEGFYSSPIRVGGLVYVLDLEGKMYIFRTGGTFELVGSPALGEQTFATPAYLDERIYIRTAQNLLCVETNG